jgi:hypothetical protein
MKIKLVREYKKNKGRDSVQITIHTDGKLYFFSIGVSAGNSGTYSQLKGVCNGKIIHSEYVSSTENEALKNAIKYIRKWAASPNCDEKGKKALPKLLPDTEAGLFYILEGV